MKTVYALVGAALVFTMFAWLVDFPREEPLAEAEQSESPEEIYDPVEAGEQTPEGFTQLLRRDAIHPVYDPTFRSAESTEWTAETLVIGLELNGEAKAYPISFLNHREMVIDWIGGSPVLVTW